MATADASRGTATGAGAREAGLSAADERHNRSRTGVTSWALYDLANTIYSFNVVSYVLPLWVLSVYERAGRGEGEANLVYGVATGLSMLLNAIVSPVMGAVSDRAGVRKPFLLFFTTLCIVPTAVIGSVGDEAGFNLGGAYVWWGLAIFALANFAYQAALIYYDSTLKTVSTPVARGRL